MSSKELQNQSQDQFVKRKLSSFVCQLRGASRTMLWSAVAIAVLTPVYHSQGISIAHSLLASVFFVLPCVLLGWIVWRRLLRAHQPFRTCPSWIAKHVVTALAFSLVWTTTFVGFVYVVRPKITMAYLTDGAIWQLTWGVVIYGALVWTAWLQARLSDRELAAAQAELQALRAQLNPHFLFNTLHSLTQLAREDPLATEKALERFGELMRYVLASGRDTYSEFSFHEEMSFVRNYLALEQMRFGPRLKIIEDIDSSVLDLAFPPLLLQPLVENAVRHGVSPRLEGGTIRLAAYELDGSLVVEVADDGCGSDEHSWRSSSGVGLRVIERQIHNRYANASELEVLTEPNLGFIARLRIPASLAASGG